MRPIIDMETVQIEITNACHNACSNCTRLVGHHKKPYFMEFETFKDAVDSMEGFPRMVGMMGGEPLLHPEFEQFCEYMHEKIAPQNCGLWTCFPDGKEHYREIIVKTFGHIFLNDQSRTDILHGPILVASEEMPIDKWFKDYLINMCWVQNSWSSSINPKGAFFCEVAAALAMLFDEQGDSLGWPVEKKWWTKVPKDFTAQMERYCKMCGCAMPLMRRESNDGRDDVSPKMLEKLKAIKSPKINNGKYVEHDLTPARDDRQMATYKDSKYRDQIAARYGMFLLINKDGYQTPYLNANYVMGKNRIEDVIVSENQRGECCE